MSGGDQCKLCVHNLPFACSNVTMTHLSHICDDLITSFTAQAPHGPSQAALMVTAMALARETAFGFVAAHGTGTPLGDPIETGALCKATTMMSTGVGDIAAPPASGFSIGGVKTLLGHTEGTAGLAGLLLAVAAGAQAAAMPLRYRDLNPFVATLLEGAPAVNCKLPLQVHTARSLTVTHIGWLQHMLAFGSACQTGACRASAALPMGTIAASTCISEPDQVIVTTTRAVSCSKVSGNFAGGRLDTALRWHQLVQHERRQRARRARLPGSSQSRRPVNSYVVAAESARHAMADSPRTSPVVQSCRHTHARHGGLQHAAEHAVLGFPGRPQGPGRGAGAWSGDVRGSLRGSWSAAAVGSSAGGSVRCNLCDAAAPAAAICAC